jgi:hypothetical protein
MSEQAIYMVNSFQFTRSARLILAHRPQGASVTYLITFACYGCHLHGYESGSVDREHNLPGSRLIEGDPNRVSAERLRMDQLPYSMDETRREAVLTALFERCTHLEPDCRPCTHQSRSHRSGSGGSPRETHEPINGDRSQALNREMVTIVQHEQKRRGRSGSPGG